MIRQTFLLRKSYNDHTTLGRAIGKILCSKNSKREEYAVGWLKIEISLSLSKDSNLTPILNFGDEGIKILYDLCHGWLMILLKSAK